MVAAAHTAAAHTAHTAAAHTATIPDDVRELWFQSAGKCIVAIAGMLNEGSPSNPTNLCIPYQSLFMHATTEDAADEAAKVSSTTIPQSVGGTPQDTPLSRSRRAALALHSTITPRLIRPVAAEEAADTPAVAPGNTPVDLANRVVSGGSNDEQPRTIGDFFTAWEAREGEEEEEEEDNNEEKGEEERTDDDGSDNPRKRARRMVTTASIDGFVESMRTRQDEGKMTCTEAYLTEYAGVSTELNKHAALAVRRCRHFGYTSWSTWNVRGHRPATLQSVFWGCATHVIGPRIIGPDLYSRLQAIPDFTSRTHLFDPFFDAGDIHWVGAYSRAIPHVLRHTRLGRTIGWSILTTSMKFRFDGLFHGMRVPHPLFERRDTNDVRGVVIECMRQYGKTTAVVLFCSVAAKHGVDMRLEVKAQNEKASIKNTSEILEGILSTEDKRVLFTTSQQRQAELFTDGKVQAKCNKIRTTTGTASSSRGFDANLIYVDEISFLKYEEFLASVAPHLIKNWVFMFLTTTPSHDEMHEFTQVLDNQPQGFWTIRFRSACADCIAKGHDAEADCLHLAYAMPGHYAARLPLAAIELFVPHPDIAAAELYGYTANKSGGAFPIAILRGTFGMCDRLVYEKPCVAAISSTGPLRLHLEREGVKHHLDEYARATEPDRWSMISLLILQPAFLKGLRGVAATRDTTITAPTIVDMLWKDTDVFAAASALATNYMAREQNSMTAQEVVQEFVTLLIGRSDTEPVFQQLKAVTEACIRFATSYMTPRARAQLEVGHSRFLATKATPKPVFAHGCLFLTSDIPSHGKSEYTVMIHAYVWDADSRARQMMLLGIDSWIDCADDNQKLIDRADRLLMRVVDYHRNNVQRVSIAVERNSDTAKCHTLTTALMNACIANHLEPIPRRENDHIVKMAPTPISPGNPEEHPYGMWSHMQRWSIAHDGLLRYMASNPILTNGEPTTLGTPGRGWAKLHELIKQLSYLVVQRPKVESRAYADKSHPYPIVQSVVIAKSKKVMNDLAMTSMIAHAYAHQYLHWADRIQEIREAEQQPPYLRS